ncbi:response regulator transcription factor [Caulobacter hibisci]|uniref:Response regulator transcription factor n=1 Tax=Caulobacter hibisci TaxID=2035993 RepID=A0ABS0SSV7_9CAUL|nr:response regulator [Caulobacter hibisci]MBI1682735.1 response regulator transcription factor [Caulobacter hibisci]
MTTPSTPSDTAALGAVCLVDDHGEFRQSAAWWLESLGYAVQAFDGARAFLDAGEPPAGACLLLDVRMPDMSGLELLDALKARGCQRPVIFMTGHGDVPLAVEAMQKGAVTFLEKPFQEAALEAALERAFAQVRPALSPGQEAYVRRLAGLTEREREVMALVVAGKVNKVIAYELGISPKTVELHRSRIMTKMEAASLTRLVRMAVTGSVDGDA